MPEIKKGVLLDFTACQYIRITTFYTPPSDAIALPYDRGQVFIRYIRSIAIVRSFAVIQYVTLQNIHIV